MVLESRRRRRHRGLGLLSIAVAAFVPGTVTAAELRANDVHARLAGSLVGGHVFRLDSGTPSERPSSVLDLRFDAEWRRRVHAFVETRAGYDGKIGNPDRGNPVLTLDEIYQDKDVFVSFDEAYVDVVAEHFELRLGKQKVSWGRLDEIQPTDNLNPEDLTEFFFRPEFERKIGVPGAKLTAYLGEWIVEGVWNPFYTAYRFPNEEDRWFPPLLTVPGQADTPFGTVPVRARYPDVDPPPRTLASSDAGLRVAGRVGRAQLSASVFHGWDKSQTYGARATATIVPTGDARAPVAPSIDLTIFPTLHRITVVGGDLAVPIWLLALRAEAAWIHGRFFPILIRDQVARDPRLAAVVAEAAGRVAASGMAETVALPHLPTELERDALQYGIGFDYTVGEALSRRLTGGDSLARTFVLLQLLETVVFDHDAPFIADQVEHLLSVTVRQTFRDERLLTELKVAYNPGHGDFLVWPQLAYKLTANLHAIFEARVLGGDETQTIGQYRDYDGIRVAMKHFF